MVSSFVRGLKQLTLPTYFSLSMGKVELRELDLSEDADVIMFTYNTRIDAEYVIPLVKTELNAIRERRLSGKYVHPRYIQAMFSGEANIQWDNAESIRNSIHTTFSQTDSEQLRSFHFDDIMAALAEVLKPYGVAEIPYWDYEIRPDDYPPRETVKQDKLEEDYGIRLTLEELIAYFNGIPQNDVLPLRDRALVALMAGAGFA